MKKRSLLALAAACALSAPLAASPAPSGTGKAEPAPAAPEPALDEAESLYLHRNQGRNLDAGVEKLEAFLAARPDHPRALWMLGRSLIRQGERERAKKPRLAFLERAQARLERSVELAGADAEAHYWLGVSVGRQGELRGIFKSLSLVKVMRREMETVLRLDPGHGGAHHVLGEMYRELPGFVGGSRKKSLEELELAYRSAPNYTASYAALAQAYEAAGRRDEAVAVLGRLLEIKAPEDPAEFEDNVKEARELLEKLR